MTTTTDSTPLLSLPAQAVNAQFASRPTLDSVAQQTLVDALYEKYPTLQIDLSRTKLATPDTSGGWTLRPLMEIVLDYLANGTEPDFSDRDSRQCFLSDVTPKRLKLPDPINRSPDMMLIETWIKALRWSLPISLQDSLATYWGGDTDTGVTRWHWISDVLMDCLRTGAINQDGLDDLERETVDQLVSYPNKEERQRLFGERAVHAFCPEIVFNSSVPTRHLLQTELLLVHSTPGRNVVLLCKPSGACERFASVDAFTQGWGQRVAKRYVVEQVTVSRYEPDGNIFDNQAAAILNQQLENLQALQLPASQGLETLRALHREITAPEHYFLDSVQASSQVLTRVLSQLPEWLQRASAADRMAYRQYSLVLASAKKRRSGRMFLSGITDIHTYTTAALWAQLKLDEIKFDNVTPEQSKARQFHPEDLQLTFTVAAGYPGGAGIIEKIPMSLTDLAIKNLASQPQGLLTLKHRHSLPLPAWLTPEYVKGSAGLIEQVDIGRTYPEMLKLHLLGDAQQVREREESFAEQTAAQLPLMALELKLKNELGFTEQGARYVRVLMSNTAQERSVGGQAVVIRPLALVRKPGAAPDVVANMFIIEAHNSQIGPHVLYRQLYAQPLQEFTTRQQLMDAIAQPGDLQSSVLTWLSASARPIYDNGGFQEPHYLRFGAGSEFAPLDAPKPPTLATEGISAERLLSLSNGRLMQSLYGSYAQALINQADRESMSTSESRWAIWLSGAELLFNALLVPYLRGPAMMTSWLLTLMSSLSHDIPALSSQDTVTQELALVDLLLNVGMLLLHPFDPTTRTTRPLSESVKQRALQPPAPYRTTGQWPVPAPAKVREGVVVLDSEALGSNNTVFDFSFSSPRIVLTPSQRTRLTRLQVRKPEPLPPPISNGPRKGLYVYQNKWYVQIDAHWYRADIELDGSVVIVSPSSEHQPGPAVQSDGNGNWSLDLKLRLRGGVPPSRIAAERQRKADRKKRLTDEYEQLLMGQAEVQKKIDGAEWVMNNAAREPKYSDAIRASTRKAFDAALRAQTDGYTQVLDTLKERSELQIPLTAQKVAILMQNTINNARKSVVIADMDRQALYAANSEFSGKSSAFIPTLIAQKTRFGLFMKQISSINERQIHALELKDRYLLDLFNLGNPGPEVFDQLTRGRPDEVSAIAVKHLQLHSLKFSSIKDFAAAGTHEMVIIFEPLQAQVLTHSELNKLDLAPADRLEVLESLCEQYGHVLDAMQGIAIVHADALEMEYFSRTQKLLEELYADVTQQLAAEVKPTPQTAKRPPKHALVSAGKPQKKVIKTRKQGTLIGELKPAGTHLPIDVVELRSEQNDDLLVTYSRHGELWDEVRDVKSPPLSPTVPGTRAINIVKGEARKHLAELDQILVREERYSKVSRYPAEVQESLQHEAVRFTDFASELDRAIQAQPEDSRLPADRLLLEELTAAATTLNGKGQELRLQRARELPPTHSNLSYLLQERNVQVARLGERVAMRGERNDFIQEYAVNDRQGHPLWYAHFHYAKADTPQQDYSVAHLKTVPQRKESYYSILAKAQPAQSVVDVHRGIIGKELAQRWFLSLAT
ncbi:MULTISPECIES: dermonecrotic toxin domain-containing protein [unclassified Pseudomonas]|uniref:dermonecrotic toxin domain-containing protein n=1 Tax=unclassified Pseudomonas TaxID=196821 RepID=UPI002AC93181|nr:MULTISPECIES: DUF6543 domain-containing protein [unclassified Pseudomonas]MEB0046943.1 hypothetical protein [Pseudomonas sp. Dout3]MEB0098091.1 hypothetical protein [Pseudomonas sp. DC1.2]WPX58391.1 hypothetical protein RHM68_22855 [Pseudomonas sp. DC1.2]